MSTTSATAITRRVLVTGGARSGKSAFAEQYYTGRADVVYVATSPPGDPNDAQWAERIRRHRARRPATWRTVQSDDLTGILTGNDGEPLLIDCLGTWLTSAMTASGCWEERPTAQRELDAKTDALVAAWRATTRHVVAVTNEVGAGVIPATASGRWFRDELGLLNAAIAAASDEVWLVTVGIGQRLK